MSLFERSVELNRVEISLRRFPVVGLVGPRRVGQSAPRYGTVTVAVAPALTLPARSTAHARKP